jgi:hypothetical protein
VCLSVTGGNTVTVTVGDQNGGLALPQELRRNDAWVGGAEI